MTDISISDLETALHGLKMSDLKLEEKTSTPYEDIFDFSWAITGNVSRLREG
jgi:hypothetical protein